MTVLKKTKSHPDVINYFKELPFYNRYIEKPKITKIKKHWLAFWTSFLWWTKYNKNRSSIKRIWNAIQSWNHWQKRSISTIRNIKDLFNDLLDETNGFKYQVTVKILSKKYKDTKIEFSQIYFNSTTKTVLNHKFYLYKSFQEILYGIDN